MTTFSVDDSGGVQRAIINDINSWSFATPRGIQDVTGVDKSALERILLLADFSITMNGTFNDTATTGSHDVLKTIPSTSIARLITMVVNAKTLAPTCLLTDYPLDHSESGELTWKVPGVLSNGVVPTWA